MTTNRMPLALQQPERRARVGPVDQVEVRFQLREGGKATPQRDIGLDEALRPLIQEDDDQGNQRHDEPLQLGLLQLDSISGLGATQPAVMPRASERVALQSKRPT